MSLFPAAIRPFMCAFFAMLSIKQPTGCLAQDTQLKTFQLFSEAPVISSITPDFGLQFNGSAPGQGAVPDQLGWWPNPTADVTEKAPIRFTGFVQNNKDRGIVFWAQRTAFEVYLAPLSSNPKTYSVELGNPRLEANPEDTLSGDFTIDKLDEDDEDGERYGFGVDGDYDNWFVCGGKKGSGEAYQLFYGERLRGCSEKFVLEARYL